MKLTSVAALVLAAGLLAGACGSDEPAASRPAATTPSVGSTAQDADPLRLWIMPDLVECIGEAPQLCMQVSRSEGGEVEWFYDSIEGFDFQEGTTYVIDVMVEDALDTPADASSLRYVLVDIVEAS